MKNPIFEGYHNPNDIVPLRYRNMFFTSVRWGSLGFYGYLAQLQTINMISSLLEVNYNKESIMLVCNLRSTASLSNKGPNHVSTAIDTFNFDLFIIPNFSSNLRD